MSRWLAMLAALFAALAVPAHADTLRVMTFNVRVPVDKDANAWTNRRDLLVETIRAEAPAIIGTQELKREQADYIIEKLPHYRWFGIDRRGGHADEHMAVFFRADRVTLESFGNFWLSDTPKVPGSISWNNLYPRMVTWGIFTSRASGKRFAVANTHFPYRDEDEAARGKAAKAIGDWTGTLPADMPVILLGDFNAAPETAAHVTLSAAFTDAWDNPAKREGPEGTFHGFTGTPGKRIDWIMLRGLTARRIATITRHKGERYPSDHFPVVADLID